MGYAGKLEEKRRARMFRSRGYSYNQILHEVNISKSTLSRWCRDIILTSEQFSNLQGRKINGADKGRLIGAKKQQEARLKRIKLFLEKGKKEIGTLTDRERFIAGVGLYLGDGSKGDLEVSFSNSNPKIIGFMMSWFRDYCHVRESCFRGQIWIHNNQNKRRAKEYWSRLMKIPPNQFRKTYVVNTKKSKKIRKKIHKYGVCSIRISRANLQRKIVGWMSGVIDSEVIK